MDQLYLSLENYVHPWHGDLILFCYYTSLNPMPNAQVCVHLTIHITKLQLQTIVPKPLYIRDFACIYRDPGR
jgi:hypothetical protein